jgi:MarR-like DNA-binding transcriptional regulator SgrR of sgrS sRNA
VEIACCYYLKKKKERYYRARLIDKLARRHGVDITVTECKIMRVSRPATPVQIMINQKQLENMEYFM